MCLVMIDTLGDILEVVWLGFFGKLLFEKRRSLIGMVLRFCFERYVELEGYFGKGKSKRIW